MYKFLTVALIALISSFSVNAQSNSSYCPQKIGMMQGDPLAIPAKEILVKIYKKLGCNIKVVPLPGTRGILHFNKKLVDGELYRLSLAEKAYEQTFVRSLVPLFKLTNAIWENSDYNISNKKPLGYVKGIKWHEEYILKHFLDMQNIAQFYSEDKMYEAFNRGAIGGFLSEKQTVKLLMDDGRLSVSPP
ncbi:hypothetical protein [Terasakiella sp.]|uniref:hypothetical protein n=1 Tax=Terasakiella sp. TaxID=2034861 RepID=UPI003AFF6CE7